MANGKINFGKQSGGVLSLTFPDGATNTEVTLPESGTLATTASATESAQGLIELATTAETQTGTDDTRAITPLKLKNSVIGLGQTWQDVTASRSVGVTYTNTTGKPIQLSITVSGSSISLTISGIVAWTGSGAVGTSLNYTSCIVPNGGTYVLSSGTISKWAELR